MRCFLVLLTFAAMMLYCVCVHNIYVPQQDIWTAACLPVWTLKRPSPCIWPYPAVHIWPLFLRMSLFLCSCFLVVFSCLYYVENFEIWELRVFLRWDMHIWLFWLMRTCFNNIIKSQISGSPRHHLHIIFYLYIYSFSPIRRCSDVITVETSL